ncbi:MAG: hypothetical protein M0Z47_12410 [Actinomycetota bacterium]|nr:hypothetical protein [Actinomycetota bacterium]
MLESSAPTPLVRLLIAPQQGLLAARAQGVLFSDDFQSWTNGIL